MQLSIHSVCPIYRSSLIYCHYCDSIFVIEVKYLIPLVDYMDTLIESLSFTIIAFVIGCNSCWLIMQFLMIFGFPYNCVAIGVMLILTHYFYFYYCLNMTLYIHIVVMVTMVVISMVNATY
jgi:hypothetical protein